MGRLSGKNAVVIGAAGEGNMGQVIARRLAAEGAKVMVAGRKEAPLKALAEEIGGAYSTCDLVKKSDVEALAAAAKEAFGGCHIAVNATGRAVNTPTFEVTEAEIAEISALQFAGVYYFLQIFGPLIGESGGGSIIQVSSATTACPINNAALYIGSKMGGDGLVLSFANELGERGVKVNSIAPGLTETPMTAQATAMPGLQGAFEARYPLGRIGSSEDVADAAVWLAEDSSFITGQVLHINGGLTLRGNPTAGEIGAAVGAAMAAQQHS